VGAKDTERSAVINNLIDISITHQNVATMAFVMVVDLSKPAGQFDLLVAWLDALRKRVDEVQREMKMTPNMGSAVDLMRAKSANLVTDKHPDK
jgi:hypothetical protein